MLECQCHWLIGAFQNFTDWSNMHETNKHRGGNKGLKIDLHGYHVLDDITGEKRIDGKLENQLLLENHTTSLLMPGICVVALLCCKYEVGRSPKWWCASACRESVS